MFVRGHTVLFCICVMLSVQERHKATTPNCVPQAKRVPRASCIFVIWLVQERHKATTSSCVPQAKRVTWASCVCVIWSIKERHKVATPNYAPQEEKCHGLLVFSSFGQYRNATGLLHLTAFPGMKML